ncbi:MAG TPA: gamma-glutamyl-gamma-aminobutyrate hydrolase family protein [Armatimonadota bacterium]|nr:gamma-glutamyl-gamma-aminobutyrate hydrolase family protein [Armatimonadota bacterium]
MVLFVVFAGDNEIDDAGKSYFRQKLRFEQLSGEPCLLVRYMDFDPRLMAELQPSAVIMSGFGRGFDTFERKHLVGMNDVVKKTDVPVLGICGSHQMIAMMHLHNVRRDTEYEDLPMRKLRPGEPDLQPGYHPGQFKETGFHHIRIVQDDPLFRGFKGSLTCLQSHYCEVKRMPKGFELLASTDECEIQAYRDADRPIYGVQFHPEGYVDAYQDGKKLLENFFRLAPTKRFAKGSRK